jgi:hypothetical protein
VKARKASPKGEAVMKWINAIALLAIASGALADHSFAQSKQVQATIPFDFTVTNKLLPAGTYLIKPQSGAHMIVIQNHDKPLTAITLVDQNGKRSKNGPHLIFNKYGDQYFLSEILCDEADMDLKVPTSKKEKKAHLDEARLGSVSQTLVAAR